MICYLYLTTKTEILLMGKDTYLYQITHGNNTLKNICYFGLLKSSCFPNKTEISFGETIYSPLDIVR